MNTVLKILLIEDNPGDAILIEELLSTGGIRFELQCVERLSLGIKQLETASFDVILLDLGLPDSFGIETLRKLNETKPKAPIIVLTGLADEAVGSEAVKSGAQDYLLKGQIDKNLLTRSISHAIERKQSLDTIQAASREWSASFDAMADGVSIHSVDNTILKANRSLLELLGKSADEVIGRKCYQVFHAKECPITGCQIGTARDTEQRGYSEMFEPTLDKWLAVSTSPVFDDSGRLTKIVHTVRDITGHRKTEEQLRQSQKMESIGTLAGGIAHDFNNILTAIIGYGSLALMKMPAADPQRLNIQNMLDAADRAANLTKQLLLFSRKQAIERKPVDLNLIVTSVAKFLQRVIGEDINFKTTVHEASLPVLADAHQLEQVLMNLATNARDSMPQSGALTVSTSLVTLKEEFPTAHSPGKPGAYALLTVTDNGAGMDDPTQQRIFDPFFTTKEVGKGTGLGLAVVYGIITQHDGYINVSSEPGVGTTFSIYLPVVPAETLQALRPERETAVRGGEETILLAEDDDAVRSLTTSVLTEFGYTVIEAVDGADAVDKFKANGAAVDLLLLDIIMPNMNGKEAFDAIRKIRPGINAVFTSGYASETVRQKVSLTEGVLLLTKPVSPLELLIKVRGALDGVK